MGSLGRRRRRCQARMPATLCCGCVAVWVAGWGAGGVPSGILPSGRQGPAGLGSLVDELLRELAWLVLNRFGERGSVAMGGSHLSGSLVVSSSGLAWRGHRALEPLGGRAVSRRGAAPG